MTVGKLLDTKSGTIGSSKKSTTIEAEAYGKCEYEGCDEENTPNGTIFCDKHAEQYANEHDYKVCAAEGCWATASSKSSYCSRHTCIVGGCYSCVLEGQRKCEAHSEAYIVAKYKKNNFASGKKEEDKSSVGSSVTRKTNGNSGSKTGTGSYRSTTGKSTSKKSSSKTYDPYDVGDYKSAQDFADDKYEEFYDYEDDYEDEDEAYDAAEEYWYDNN